MSEDPTPYGDRADKPATQPPFPLSIPRPPGFGFKEVDKATALTAIGAFAGDLVERVDIERTYWDSYNRQPDGEWHHRRTDWWKLTVAFRTQRLDWVPLQAQAPKLRAALETIIQTLDDIMAGRTSARIKKPKPEGQPEGKHA